MSDLQATYPQTFLPSRLAAGEEYASVGDILAAEDLPQATLHIPHWRLNGKPAAIRVRALSLIERDQVQRETDTVAQHCLIWQFGCLMPRFTAAQANELQDKNPYAIEQVATFIMTLGALRQEWIDHVVTTQTNAAAATPSAEPGGTGDTAATPRVRRLARAPRGKVRAAPRATGADA